jgi:hypothetical protein
VVTAPPAYAPDIISSVTMYDLIYDAIAGANFPARAKPRFTEEILPMLRGLVDFQWVNTGFFFQFGWRGPWEFTRPDFVARLAAPGNQFQELRRQVFQMFRNPSITVPFQALTWPQLYGDGLGIAANGVESPRNGMAVTGTQYEYLSQWVNGNFVANFDPDAKPPQSLDEVGLQDQPDTLDRAALAYCLGGPFHPGNEMTWPMRRYSMYRGKFRLRRHPEGWAYPDYGDFLNQTTALAPSGPLAASGPGDITRWMSVPWHADTASCQQGYPGFENASLFNQDPFLPSFWPTRAPNEVLAEEDYRIVVDQTKPMADRIAAFNRRKDWIRTLGPLSMPYVAQITKMVEIFDQMGIIEQRPGVANDPNFPAVIYVEALGAPQGTQTMKAVVGAGGPSTVTQELQPEGPATMSRAFMQTRFGGRRRP